MQNAARISPTNFRVTSVLGMKREGDKTARGRNNHKAHDLVRSSEKAGLILARDLCEEPVNALSKVLGFLQVLQFPSTGKVDRVG